MKDLRNIIADNNQAVEKASIIYVLTVHINNGDDIDEAFTQVFKRKSSAVTYVKKFIEEVKGGFDTCQVDYGKNFEYADINAGDFSEYCANLSIEKQSVI